MVVMSNAVTKKPVVYAPNVPVATSGDITKSGIKNPPAFNNVATIPDAPPIHSGPISGSSTSTVNSIGWMLPKTKPPIRMRIQVPAPGAPYQAKQKHTAEIVAPI